MKSRQRSDRFVLMPRVKMEAREEDDVMLREGSFCCFLLARGGELFGEDGRDLVRGGEWRC